jgi:MFS family permease
MTGLFASMIMPLVPVVARDVLDSGATGFGILSAALGAGLAVGSATLILMGDARRKARLMLGSHLVASAAIALFGLSHSLALSAALAFAFGIGMAVGGNIIVTLFQLNADESMRGRVMGVYSVTSAMVPLGGVLGGWTASALGVETALLISAISSFAPALLAYFRSPALRRL